MPRLMLWESQGIVSRWRQVALARTQSARAVAGIPQMVTPRRRDRIAVPE